MCSAMSTRSGRQNGEIVWWLFRSVQRCLRQGHAPGQNRRWVPTFYCTLKSEFWSLFHGYELISWIQPAAIYQQIRPSGRLWNTRKSSFFNLRSRKVKESCDVWVSKISCIRKDKKKLESLQMSSNCSKTRIFHTLKYFLVYHLKWQLDGTSLGTMIFIEWFEINIYSEISFQKVLKLTKMENHIVLLLMSQTQLDVLKLLWSFHKISSREN